MQTTDCAADLWGRQVKTILCVSWLLVLSDHRCRTARTKHHEAEAERSRKILRVQIATSLWRRAPNQTWKAQNTSSSDSRCPKSMKSDEHQSRDPSSTPRSSYILMTNRKPKRGSLLLQSRASLERLSSRAQRRSIKHQRNSEAVS